MSSSLGTIPRRAVITHRAYVVSPDGARSAVLTVYADMRSHGYQTDYAPVMVAWYAVDAPGVVRRCWRYSGRRYVRAEQDYRDAIATIAADGWAVDVDADTAPGVAGVSRSLAYAG
jgi:hypothetical protein